MSLKELILGLSLTTAIVSNSFSQSEKSMDAFDKAIQFKIVAINYDSAEYYLKKAIGYDGKNISAYESLFQLYQQKNEDVNAMICLIDCITTNENISTYKKRLENIWKKNNSPGDNLDDFIEEVDSKTIFLLADSLKKAGNKFDKIRYEYDQLGLDVPELSVDTRKIYYGFAREIIDSMIYVKGDFLAKPFIKKADTYEKLQMYTQALSEYSRAIKFNPKNPEYHARKAKAYLVLNYEQRAINEFNETINLDPDNGLANKELGLIYLKKRNITDALIYLTSSVFSADDFLKPKNELQFVWKNYYSSPCGNFDEFLNNVSVEFDKNKKNNSFQNAIQKSLTEVIVTCSFD